MTHDVEAAVALAHRLSADLIPLLKRWVEVNSFTDNVAGVNAVGDLLAEAFAIDGLSLQRIVGDGCGDHLFWRTTGWDRRPDARTVLIGHHDTVFPPGTFDSWVVDGALLRGPGVLDMKGGLLVIRTAMCALAEIGALDELALGVVSVGDEETGSTDSRRHLEEFARGARQALVFEAGRTRDQIITQRKGTGKLRVTVHGTTAHAGNNHAEGKNAIWALAQFIDRAQRETDYERGVTVNVGLVSGGTSANTVPGRAECSIDFRFVRSVDGHALVSRLDAVAQELAAAGGVRFVLDGGVRRDPLERSAASVDLMERYARCAELAGLAHDECVLIGGGSDANTVSAIGVPAIDGLGPRGRGFHTNDEQIEIATLAQRVEALVRFCMLTAH